MELGEKLLCARQEAGLSQRQLCGDVITRNMLSQIEHGTARPSMDTLQYLASRLGKSVSYFLEEDVVTSSNLSLMQQARQAWKEGDTEKTRQLLLAFQFPDETFAWEWRYLTALCSLAAAKKAISQGKILYAQKLLEETETDTFSELKRRKLLLCASIPGADLQDISRQLPSLDEELLIRAEAALIQGKLSRAADLLAAAEDKENLRWNLLRGRTFVLQKQYAEAVKYLEKAEATYPKDCASLLEICFRELGNFQKAYFYACKQR